MKKKKKRVTSSKQKSSTAALALKLAEKQVEHSSKAHPVLRFFISGFAMGSADIVPGVSGGTVALILGIYEQLLSTIKGVTSDTLKLLIKGSIVEAWRSIPFSFLVPLGLGIVSAIVLLSSALEYLLFNQPVPTWSFFFGLIIASVVVVSKRVSSWSLNLLSALLIASVVAFFIVGLVPVSTPATPVAFFLAGMIAICAMILPGISGSFILILLGKYEQVLSAVSSGDAVTLGIVMMGAVVGLAIFSKILSWLFDKYHDLTIAILTGFMVGSLRKIWPWKEILQTRINSHGVVEPVVTKNVLPESVSTELFIAAALACFAVALVFYIESYSKKNE